MSANGDDGSFGVCLNGQICEDESVLRGDGGSDAKRLPAVSWQCAFSWDSDRVRSACHSMWTGIIVTLYVGSGLLGLLYLDPIVQQVCRRYLCTLKSWYGMAT